jgi:hypothetical protein
MDAVGAFRTILPGLVVHEAAAMRDALLGAGRGALELVAWLMSAVRLLSSSTHH